jgi:hypothetical protein
MERRLTRSPGSVRLGAGRRVQRRSLRCRSRARLRRVCAEKAIHSRHQDFPSMVPATKMRPHGDLVPLLGVRPRGPTRPPLVPRSGRPGDRNHHVAPRGSGPAAPGRPTYSAASTPGTSCRAVTPPIAGAPERLLRPASHPVALAPRPRPPTLDLPTPPIRSTHGRCRHRRPRRPVSS